MSGRNRGGTSLGVLAWIAALSFCAIYLAEHIGGLKRRCAALESRVAALEAKQ